MMPLIFKSFIHTDRVTVVSGGSPGLSLEMALALSEAGVRVYAHDLPSIPGDSFQGGVICQEILGREKAGVCLKGYV